MRTTLALLAVLVSLSGCMSAELARVRRDVGRDLPGAHLSEGHAFQFGRLSMGLARSVVGSDGDDAATAAALEHVRGVAVGTYTVNGAVDPQSLALPRTVERITRRGWTPVVVSREDDTAAYIFAREDDASVSDLLILSFEDQELTLVRLSGRLDEALRAVLASDDEQPALIGSVQRAIGLE